MQTALEQLIERLARRDVEHREKQHGTRHVGVLTDGVEWRCYNLQRGRLSEVACYTLAASKPNVDEFLVWLEGVLADERHIDKHIWKLPIPMFDEENPDHAALASLGQKAEESIAKLPVDTEKHFAASRRMIRAFLAESELGQEIERRVTALVT